MLKTFLQDLLNAAHALIGGTLVEVEYGHADRWSFFRMHGVKLTNEADIRQGIQEGPQMPFRNDACI